MTDPKPLVFKDEEKRPTSEVKPLQFSDAPTATVGAPLNFASSSSGGGKPLFQTTNTNLLDKAMQGLQAVQSPVALRDRIERQVRQLADLNVDQIMNWGGPAVNAEVNIVRDINAASASFAALRSNEMLDKISKDIDNKSSLFERLTNKIADIDSIKQQLMRLRDAVKPMLTTIAPFKKSLPEIEERLEIFTMSLKLVEEAAKSLGSYESVEDIMYNRRVLLTQAYQQLQFSKAQLEQLEKLIHTTIHSVEQMEKITLPAYEAAQSLKRK